MFLCALMSTEARAVSHPFLAAIDKLTPGEACGYGELPFIVACVSIGQYAFVVTSVKDAEVVGLRTVKTVVTARLDPRRPRA